MSPLTKASWTQKDDCVIHSKLKNRLHHLQQQNIENSIRCKQNENSQH